MTVLIPMAGSGRRFVEAGLDTPKYKIVANGRPLLHWALASLSDFFDCRFIFISRDSIWDEAFVANVCQQLGIRTWDRILSDQPTDGQASTVLLADASLAPDESICIYNVDTHVAPRAIRRDHIAEAASGFIPLFRPPGSHWSFAETTADGIVLRVAEKERISDNATIGFYYFARWEDYRTILGQRKSEIKAAYREAYVAPMYQYLIEDGKTVTSSLIALDDVVALGTPEEVDRFDPSFRSRNP